MAETDDVEENSNNTNDHGHVVSAEELAALVRSDDYKLAQFHECDGKLPLDRNSHNLLLSQFLLFENPDQGYWTPPEYLIVRPQDLLAAGDDVDGNNNANAANDNNNADATIGVPGDSIKKTAANLARLLPTNKLGPPDETTREALGSVLEKAVKGSVARRLAARRPEHLGTDIATRQLLSHVNEADLELTTYTDWYKDVQLRALNAVARYALSSGTFIAGGIKDNPALIKAIREQILGLTHPHKYQPLANAVHAHLALCATFSQTWSPVGYSRGELIQSISLAPGERVTLEFHTWDKSTVKTEEELAVEFEMRSSEKMTQRDAQTVTQEFSKRTTTQVDAKGSVPLGAASFGASASTRTETTRATNTTNEQVSEGTVEASNALKVNRKSRIEVTRETGQENRQTRVIENTNRCHTLNCHYFEIMANYVVTTKLESLQPCLLIANDEPTIDIDWIVCNEHVLREVLLNKTFLGGFDAARALKARQIAAHWQQSAQEAAEVTDEAAEVLWTAIETAATGLLDDWDIGKIGIAETNGKEINIGAVDVPLTWFPEYWWNAFAFTVALALHHIMYVISIPDLAFSSLQTIPTLATIASTEPRKALQTFFQSGIRPNMFAVRPSSTTAEARLVAAGVPAEVAEWLKTKGKLDQAGEDAGIQAAVSSAANALGIAGDDIAAVAGASVAGFQISSEVMETAGLQASFDQLQCHIEANLSHYTQAVWLREHQDDRFRRLQNEGQIATLIDNSVLGFLGNKAAYPLKDRTQARKWLDSDVDLEVLEAELKRAFTSRLITMPTPGTVLEALLGECDACEEFIRNHRLLDLKMQEAKLHQEEAEADRLQQRLSQTPPLLDDPQRPPSTFQINVESSGEIPATETQ